MVNTGVDCAAVIRVETRSPQSIKHLKITLRNLAQGALTSRARIRRHTRERLALLGTAPEHLGVLVAGPRVVGERQIESVLEQHPVEVPGRQRLWRPGLDLGHHPSLLRQPGAHGRQQTATAAQSNLNSASNHK